MKIDHHVMYRLVQKVIGVSDDCKIQKYINDNYYEVVYRILEFINESILLIENYAPSRRDTLDYYINGETLLIMKPKKAELVTLYDITLDAEDRENSHKIRQYVKK
ncbi:hypothetical protein JNUCC23_09040 [Peribacillus sp. JNUCC 23]|uniref:hypothetical protein n=1 Tax=Peribacillus sp. NPDC096379 TaxID=3364393 RepID=UPI00382F4408